MDSVEALMQAYIRGTYTADTHLLASTFHEQAIMTGSLGDGVAISSPAPYIEDIGSQPSMEELDQPYQAEIIDLVTTGQIASVTLAVTGFRGKVAMKGHFHLFNSGEKWQIISKLFTVL